MIEEPETIQKIDYWDLSYTTCCENQYGIHQSFGHGSGSGFSSATN